MIYSFRSYNLPWQRRHGRDTGVGGHIVGTLRKQIGWRSVIYMLPFFIQSETTVYGILLFISRGALPSSVKSLCKYANRTPILAFLNFKVKFPDTLSLPPFMPAKLVPCMWHCQLLAPVQRVILPFCMIFLRKDFYRQLFLSTWPLGRHSGIHHLGSLLLNQIHRLG